MKVTVITGSPHKKGTSALLADEFIRGAQEAGWDTFRFDAAFEKVTPCLGCDRCGIGAAPCVQKDAMQKLMPELLTSQVVALVTPLILLLPRLWGLGAYGVFAAEPVSDVIGGLTCYITMMCTVWQEMKQPDRV